MRLVLVVSTVLAAFPASAADFVRRPFGTMPNGAAVEAITLMGGRTTATIITLGATLQALTLPDRTGRIADVVLGYDDLAGYVAKPNYFGATVGRFANRIAKGRFVFDGHIVQTDVNDGPNMLHGGAHGFDKAVWQIVSVERGKAARVTLRLVSPDGDQGFPGTMAATAIYAVDDAGNLDVTYRATTDKPTVVNLSQHAYWSLGGEGGADGATGELLTIPADKYTPVDNTLIPSGEFRSVAGTPFDFRRPTPVVARLRDGRDEQLRYGRGYDHNWVLSRRRAAAPRLIARLEDRASGRAMELFSDQPGLQFYSGNFLDGTIAGKSGHIYRAGDAIVLEPQMFPDTPNHPEFGSVRLDPGQTYVNHISYRFSITPAGE